MKAWTQHGGWHMAWSRIHECALQLLQSSPVKHYECVKTGGENKCCAYFTFFGYKLEMSCCTKWGKITFADKLNIGCGQSSFFKTISYFSTLHDAYFQMLCYVTTLTEEDRRLCRKQLIMFCDKVYILFSNWYSRNTRIQLLFWQVMLSFYLKAEKCLQKKQKQMQQLLRNTINFIFKNVKLFYPRKCFCKCISAYFHVTTVGLNKYFLFLSRQ